MSASAPPSVLVVEDDADLRGALELLLLRGGFSPIVRPDGRAGLRAFHETRPDVVVLDIGLPDIDGWTVLERIRDLSDVPVLVLTARNLELDKVRGLQAGADDYMTKPFGNSELVARVHALIRRSNPPPRVPETLVLEDAGLRLDVAAREVHVDGDAVSLTPLEFRLLHALLEQRGRVISPEELLELAWSDPVGTNPERVKFAVLRLRRKLGRAGSSIRNVRGFGYRI